jgi:hypothetical protein
MAKHIRKSKKGGTWDEKRNEMKWRGKSTTVKKHLLHLTGETECGGSGDRSPRPPRREWTDDKIGGRDIHSGKNEETVCGWPESRGDKGGGFYAE